MMKKMFLLLLVLVLAVSIGIVGCTAPAEEEEEEPEEIVLTFGAQASETHFLGQLLLEWQEKITEDTDGRVQWENYYGGALVSFDNTYAEVVAGLVDVADMTPRYEQGEFPIQKRYDPFFIGALTQDAEISVFTAITQMFPEIEAEFSEVKILDHGVVSSPYELMTSKPVYSLDDLDGLQLKSPPGYISVLAEYGATGQVMSMFELYPSLETGVIDGLIGQTETLESFNFADLLKYHTTLSLPFGPYNGHIMNLDVWNSLPSDIQQVFEDNREFRTSEYIDAWEQITEDGIEYALEQGVEFIELAPEELAEFHELVKAVAEERAKELDDQGLPGTEIYTEVKRLIAEYNA